METEISAARWAMWLGKDFIFTFLLCPHCNDAHLHPFASVSSVTFSCDYVQLLKILNVQMKCLAVFLKDITATAS